MRSEVLTLALLVGFCTWAFRVFPTRADLSTLAPTGILARFLAATGPAAIATLFVASVMPWLQGGVALPMICGIAAVLAAYAGSRSVVAATLAGSVGYGFAVWGLAFWA
ncbi:AzlD domain-containing protein [Cypionkella sp.]|jgi:hypothetical protein|uniref:AzlD domain-containing protein n=1 Tax=Cypionkella sp. TaxID=2811411 RepID=UPI002767E11E|nr:AzlD domain-containing protein [Cypionkella sp.]